MKAIRLADAARAGGVGARAPNGLTPVGESRIGVAGLGCSSVRYVEYLPSSRLGPLATARFPPVRQPVRCSRLRPASASVGGSESVCGQRGAAGVVAPHVLEHLLSATRAPPTNTLSLTLTGSATREPDPGERVRLAPVFWLVLAFLSSGCTGVFARAGGESLSLGTHSHGALLGAVALPSEGEGFEVHPDWRVRGRNFAIGELVSGLMHSLARVQQAYPGSVAYVGDLSLRGGGGSSMHRSHESGRDVDVFCYSADRQGNPLARLPAMIRFAPDGSAAGWSSSQSGRRLREPLPEAQFDRRRNWALVAALLSEPGMEVQWIFLHKPLADLLLQEAEQEKADPALVARAREILHQPTDSRPHDDHMHVRVFCPAHSRTFGCFDKGPRRWWSKRWKYLGSAPLATNQS